MENTELRNRRESENQSIARLNEAAAQRVTIEIIEKPAKPSIFALEQQISLVEAWSYFGLMLGTIPPAAIFLRFLSLEHSNESFYLWLTLMIAANVFCAVAGRLFAKNLSRTMLDFADVSWLRMLLILPFAGFLWGAITGFCGGLTLVGFGAIVGAICAVPIGVAAFTAFGILHRLLAQSGDIERRYFLPVAFGVCLTISAFILGL